MSREWTLRAACRGRPLELFYSPAPEVTQDTIKRYCENCPVLQECAQDAWDSELEANAAYGVRAGMTGRQRKKIINSFKKRLRKVTA